MSLSRVWMLLLLSWLLAGCALAPGQRVMPATAYPEFDEWAGAEIVERSLAQALREEPEQAACPQPFDLDTPEYRLGVSDQLFLTLWHYPELTSQIMVLPTNVEAVLRQVQPDGRVNFPYIGPLVLQGLTIDQARERVAKAFSAVLARPQLDLVVVRYNSQKVHLTGAFQRAISLPMSNRPVTVADALAAGGIDLRQARLDGLVLLRDNKIQPLCLQALMPRLGQLHLRAGDTLHLPLVEEGRINVSGRVKAPVSLPMPVAPLSLLQALALAGGVDQDVANAGEVFVIRPYRPDPSLSYRRVQVIKVDFREPGQIRLADLFQMQPGDQVVVDPTLLSRFNAFVLQLFPGLSFFRSTRLVLID